METPVFKGRIEKEDPTKRPRRNRQRGVMQQTKHGVLEAK